MFNVFQKFVAIRILSFIGSGKRENYWLYLTENTLLLTICKILRLPAERLESAPVETAMQSKQERRRHSGTR
jgi:hypothetical protein